MSDTFTCLSLEQLLIWIKREEVNGKIFGIPKELFFKPHRDDPFRLKRYGQLLETPVGVAAGPHTQLSQNIISAWLSGARYIELKTVQILDELEVTKPCIDMGDEGYNCEWSQELKLDQSLDEYLNALVAIHVLKRHLKLGSEKEPGFIFNMSVGYNLEGILSPGVQNFLNSMADAGDRIAEKRKIAEAVFPGAGNLVIDPCVSNNITISTMHGCPPDEIEKIGRYFIKERKLNTTIKLNPTLLGPEELRGILNNRLGFYNITVPDIAFEHDLKYDAGVALINSLLIEAEKAGVAFNIKLTNTLETQNDRNRLPENEAMLYMSGRPLHVISTNLAARLQKDFEGKLDISFSAGSDCYNISETLGCGLQPVTVCSDILKPGGYGRIAQYLSIIRDALEKAGASSIGEYVQALSKKNSPDPALSNLNSYAEKIKDQPRYHKKNYPWESIKTKRELAFFDCIQAPCKGTCPAGQDVPSYMYYTSRGMFGEALQAILKTNPFPNVQGLVCDHPCTDKCTRINFDEPLKIREIKRFIAQNSPDAPQLKPASDNKLKTAVIGGGPSGFSAAYFLRMHGFSVDLFEAKPFGGGMAADAIPSFRLDDSSIEEDIERIVKLGVKVHYRSAVDLDKFNDIRNDYDYVYIGVGAAAPYLLEIPGAEGRGVFDQLEFLSAIRRGNNLETGNSFAVIGGGNSAMDAARAARRLAGADGSVVVLYRRGIDQMPADREEIEALVAEKIEIMEMVNPVRVILEDGRVSGIECQRMEPGELDESGRPRPVVIDGSEFVLKLDTVISAIGQRVVIPFLENDLQVDRNSFETEIEKVYAGGDAIRGASTLIKAIGDGQKAVNSILVDAALSKVVFAEPEPVMEPDPAQLETKMASRSYASDFFQTNSAESLGFDLVSLPITKEIAMEEAGRCLSCDTLCNICVTVCPNRANLGYNSPPFKAKTYRVSGNIGSPKIKRAGTYTVSQTHQVINIADFCNECGNCTTFCPSAGAPYKDKPKFYLTKGEFDQENSGFLLEGSVIYKKTTAGMVSFSELQDSYCYESEQLKAIVDKNSFEIWEVSLKSDCEVGVELTDVAELGYLYQALKPVLGG